MRKPKWTPAEEEALRAQWRGSGRPARALAKALALQGFPLRTADALKAKAVKMKLEGKVVDGWISFTRWCRVHRVGAQAEALRRTAKTRKLLTFINARWYFRPGDEPKVLEAWADVRRGGMTAKAAGRRLGVGCWQIRIWATKGLLKATRLSERNLVFDPAEIAELAASQAKYKNLIQGGLLLHPEAIAQQVGMPVRLVHQALKLDYLKGERLWWPGKAGHPCWYARKEDVGAWIAAGAPTSAEGLLPHWISGGKERRDAKA